MRAPVLAILDPFRSPQGPYNFRKDTSHLILLELARRGHKIYYGDLSSLFLENGSVKVLATNVSPLATEPYFTFHEEDALPADRFSLILMRKDPPVDPAYLYATYLLSLVPRKVWMVNDPRALREWNEKLVIFQFPQWIPPTLVTANKREIDRFVRGLGGLALIKPLAGYGGKAVRKLDRDGADYITLIDEMTSFGILPVMVQQFLPAISRGEKRVFLIDGKPIGALLKVPPEGGFITNPDLGGHLAPTQLTAAERRLCLALRPFLRKNGIFFAGIDLIGERLIEINITSPGLVWEWNEVDNRNHHEEIVDAIERKLKR
jgi:glutathione synthase